MVFGKSVNFKNPMWWFKKIEPRKSKKNGNEN